MARSRHPPRKNVGGKAPRKNLAAKAGKKIFNQLKKMNGNGISRRRYRPGTKALYQIRQYQKRTDLLICK
jgi:histone H3